MHPLLRGRKCTSLGGEESHFYWVEEGTRLIKRVYGVFHRVRRMTSRRSSAFEATIECKNPGYAYDLDLLQVC